VKNFFFNTITKEKLNSNYKIRKFHKHFCKKNIKNRTREKVVDREK